MPGLCEREEEREAIREGIDARQQQLANEKALSMLIDAAMWAEQGEGRFYAWAKEARRVVRIARGISG